MDDSGQDNVFLASSPRHMYLAAGLALQASESRNELYFIEHVRAETVTRYLDLLRSWKSSPFSTLTRLRGDYRPELQGVHGIRRDLQKRALKRRYRHENSEALRKRLAQRPAARIVVGCDNYYESQFLLTHAKARDASTRGVLLEDGTAVYDYDFRQRPLRRERDWLRKLSYGSWWRPCPIVGTSGLVDEAHVAFPELVLDELRGLDLHALSPEIFRGEAFRDLARATAQSHGIDLDAIRKASLIIVLTRSAVAARMPDYARTVMALCESFLEAGESVAVKYHPRETEHDFVPLQGREGVHVIPSAILFELVLTLVESPSLTVVGDASTALLATRWLHPEVRILALRHGTQGPASRYLEKPFRALGIPVESDPRRIRADYFSDRALR